MSKSIVWTIAGSDSGGGAGIQADLHTFHAFDVHGCSVIAAITAQNSQSVSRIAFVSAEMITAQIQALASDLPACAIKMGMLGSLETLQTLLPFVKQFSGPLIYDPVLFATVGDALHEGDIRHFLLTNFIPLVTLLTPNIPEAEWLLGRTIETNEQIESAAQDLLAIGAKSVLIKGGHATFQKQYCQDYFSSVEHKVWLTSNRHDSMNTHGTGCSLSAAITACVALNYPLLDALVIAKAYVSQGIRLSQQLGMGPGSIAHESWPSLQNDYPVITKNHQRISLENNFPQCEMLGFYPIVDSVEWVKKLLMNGVNTIQLRIKHGSKETLSAQLEESIKITREYKACLYINDYWELAIKFGAYGVHLGQDDLETADLEKIQKAGLRLGVSTHSYSEVARALALKPSYIAIGPIYHTTTKIVPFPSQGLMQLHRYCKMLTCPVVAIGGITFERLSGVWQTGVNGVAVISALKNASDVEVEIKKWLDFFLASHDIGAVTC